jgi:ankyrin repeat protein
MTPLHEASAAGEEETVRAILDASLTSLNAADDQLWRPLSLASREGHSSIVRLLLEYGAEVDALGTDTNHTALCVAAQYNHIEVVELLLRAGANVNIGAERQCGPYSLLSAAKGGNLAILKLFVEHGADINKPSCSTGLTLIFFAAEHHHYSIVKYLLEDGVPAAKQFSLRGAPLLTACRNGDVELVKLLFDRRVQIGYDLRGHSKTAMATAVSMGHTVVVNELLSRGADFKAEEGNLLRTACSGNNLELVRVLLDHGIDVNANNVCALTAAAPRGERGLFELLLERGTDMKAGGGRALSEAKAYQRDDIVEYLIDHGAVETYRDPYTKLISASRDRDFPAVEQMMIAGIDPNMEGPDGRAIRVAIDATYNLLVVKLLLRYGASLKQEKDILATLLQKNDLDLVILLIEHGVKVGAEAPKISRMTAARGNIKAAKMLLDEDIYLEDESGINHRPLPSQFYFTAARNGHNDMIQFLIDRGALAADIKEKGAIELYHALTSNKLETAKLLMRYGAELSPLNSGLHALVAASQRGHVHIVEYLLNQDLDLNAFDCGFKALLLACDSGMKDVVDLLLNFHRYLLSDEYTRIISPLALKNSSSEIVNILGAASSATDSTPNIDEALKQRLPDYLAAARRFITIDWEILATMTLLTSRQG